MERDYFQPPLAKRSAREWQHQDIIVLLEENHRLRRRVATLQEKLDNAVDSTEFQEFLSRSLEEVQRMQLTENNPSCWATSTRQCSVHCGGSRNPYPNVCPVKHQVDNATSGLGQGKYLDRPQNLGSSFTATNKVPVPALQGPSKFSLGAEHGAGMATSHCSSNIFESLERSLHDNKPLITPDVPQNLGHERKDRVLSVTCTEVGRRCMYGGTKGNIITSQQPAMNKPKFPMHKEGMFSLMRNLPFYNEGVIEPNSASRAIRDPLATSTPAGSSGRVAEVPYIVNVQSLAVVSSCDELGEAAETGPRLQYPTSETPNPGAEFEQMIPDEGGGTGENCSNTIDCRVPIQGHDRSSDDTIPCPSPDTCRRDANSKDVSPGTDEITGKELGIADHGQPNEHIFTRRRSSRVSRSSEEEMVELFPGSGVQITRGCLKEAQSSATFYGMVNRLMAGVLTEHEFLNCTVMGRKYGKSETRPPIDSGKVSAIMSAVQATFGDAVSFKMIKNYMSSHLWSYRKRHTTRRLPRQRSRDSADLLV